MVPDNRPFDSKSLPNALERYADFSSTIAIVGLAVVNRVRDSKVTLVLNTPNLNVRDNQTGGCLSVK